MCSLGMKMFAMFMWLFACILKMKCDSYNLQCVDSISITYILDSKLYGSSSCQLSLFSLELIIPL
jgi:hypothetical protein